MNIDMGAVGETEAVIQAELNYDRSEWHPFNGWRTTLKVVEALAGGFFLECDVLTSRAEDVPSNYLTIPP